MKRFLIPGTLLLTVLWAFTQQMDLFSDGATFMQWRRALIVLSGTIGLLWMTTVVCLALRPAWVERSVGGLDHMYRLHKWAGIVGTLVIAVHWLLEQSPKWLRGLGLLQGQQAHQHHGAQGASIHGMAKFLGEWGFYLMALLVVIALLRRVPYRYFRQLHKVFPILFLAAVFHSVVLLPTEAYTQPLGWIVALLAVVGTIAAVLCLTGRIGVAQRYSSRLSEVQVLANGLITLQIDKPANWPGHRGGQFALLDFGDDGAHPFSMTSATGPHIGFAIKPLGDYTQTLASRLKPGDRVIIEGPYGGFVFADDGAHQIWIAGGIGVTPFIARLESLLAEGAKSVDVDFFVAAKNELEAAFPAQLQALCERAGVRLHRKIQSVDGEFSAAEILAKFKQQDSSVWFCGPAGWGRSLSGILLKRGISSQAFHQELFEFR